MVTNSLWSSDSQTSIRSFFLPKRKRLRSPPTARKRKATVASPPTPKARKRSTTTPCSPPPQKTQLYLDFGQKNFAKNSECKICGMLYVHGLEEDAKRHLSICKDYQTGVAFDVKRKGCRILSKNKDCTIVEVRPSDTAFFRNKVAQVVKIVHQELGFVETVNTTKQRTAYITVIDKKIVGLVLAESIAQQQARRYENGVVGKVHDSSVKLGIQLLWVHQKHRQKHIGTKLIDAARSNMVFGYTVLRNRVAFSSPTEAGLCFAKSYTEDNVFVYDA